MDSLNATVHAKVGFTVALNVCHVNTVDDEEVRVLNDQVQTTQNIS